MSNFFDSQQVQSNLQDIFNTYQRVAYETSRLAGICLLYTSDAADE